MCLNRVQYPIRIVAIAVMLSLWSGCQTADPPDTDLALSNDEFSATIDSLSEPSAFFDSDNIISNEISYLHIIEAMENIGVQGGVYIGVGPDQNFTYIARIKPKYAFILDIRRDNLLEHLLFKAIMELADSRTEYLSILFSKPTSTVIPSSELSNIAHLVDYFDNIEGDEAYFNENLVQIKDRINTYEIDLSQTDWEKIADLSRMFYDQHLNLQWEYKSDGSRGISFIPYRSFLLGQDRHGEHGNFLNDEGDYLYIREMQLKNLIIPLTGNFAGDKALKAIGKYIKNRRDYVSAFYLSNVEYYLLPDGLMASFAENVRQLPIKDHSVLIRAFVNLRGRAHPDRVDRHLMTTVMQYIRSFNEKFAEGRYHTYFDVGVLDYIP